MSNTGKKQTITFSHYDRKSLEYIVNEWLAANDYEVVETKYQAGVGFLGGEGKHYCEITFVPDSKYWKNIEEEAEATLLEEQRKKEEWRNMSIRSKILHYLPLAVLIGGFIYVMIMKK